MRLPIAFQDNQQISLADSTVVNRNRRTPEPIPPPRYYVSQHLNLLGANPTISSGSRPHEIPAHKEMSRKELEVESEQIQTPKNHEVPDELEDDNLPPHGTATETGTGTRAS